MDDVDNTIQLMEFKSRFILKEGIDIDNRTISIDGPISHKSYTRFDKQLMLLENFHKDPITIYINSGGGDVYSMFAYVDRITGSSCAVNTVGTGLIASASIAILAAGKERSATANSSFMHHTSSYSAGYEKVQIHANELQHIKELERRVCKFLAKVTNKPYNFWLSSGKHTDMYFDTEYALEVGLIHDII